CVDGLRVSELAERAGAAPSTVRFYERAGLLSPARRAARGSRVFDESAPDELAFISRAKGIGMSLEDIADLVASWPAGECRSLHARLRAYLAGRISQVRQQAAEMGMFERQLQAVLDRLSARDPGPSTAGRTHLRGRSRPPPPPGPPRPAVGPRSRPEHCGRDASARPISTWPPARLPPPRNVGLLARQR